MRTRRLGLISIGLALALDLAVGSSSTGLRARELSSTSSMLAGGGTSTP
jgi:hypothetical protein